MGAPILLAKIANRGWAVLHSLGIYPDRYVTLEVAGRKSGKMIRFPLAMTRLNGERYLVAMLGQPTNWVRNVRAAGGKARLVHGISEQVRLAELDDSQKAPVLRPICRSRRGPDRISRSARMRLSQSSKNSLSISGIPIGNDKNNK